MRALARTLLETSFQQVRLKLSYLSRHDRMISREISNASGLFRPRFIGYTKGMHLIAFFALLSVAGDEEPSAPEGRDVADVIAELAADPLVRWGSASAATCYFAQVRGKAVEEIRTEQRYARELAGVQNNVKLLVLQNIVRRSDEGKAAAAAELARLKKKATSCANPKTAKLVRCIGDSYDGTMDNEECAEMGVAVAVVSVVMPKLETLLETMR
jgi:hypothetical protein